MIDVIEASTDMAATAGLEFRYRISSALEAPVLLLVHGRGGDSKVMWSFNRILPKGFNVISPQAMHADAIGGHSWWLVDSELDQAPNIAESSKAIGIFYQRILSLFSLKPKLVIACGFSQGGALLTNAIRYNHLKCDGLALLSSFVLPKDFTVSEQLPEVFMAHGENDEVIPFERAKRAYAVLEEAGVEVFFVEDKTGHKVGVNGMRCFKEWLESYI